MEKAFLQYVAEIVTQSVKIEVRIKKKKRKKRFKVNIIKLELNRSTRFFYLPMMIKYASKTMHVID